MWQILLLSLCSAPLQLVAAEDLQHWQVTGVLKFSPAVQSPFPNIQPSLNYPAENLGEKTFEVPLTYNKLTNQFEGPQTSPDNCPQLESLENILVLLKRLLNQEDNTYILQPAKRIQILQSLNEYLQKSGSHVGGGINGLKLKKLIARTDNAVLVENSASSQITNDVNKKNHVEANLIFKYDVPAINNVGCKEALAALIKTVRDAHLQVIKYCNQSGKCNFNSDPDPLNIQQNDKYNTFIALDSTMPTQTKITLPNPNLSNIYDIGSSINNLVTPNNQILNQNSLNDYSNLKQSDLNSNHYLPTSNSVNSGIVQTQNNEEKHVNINLNKEASQSNVQYSDKLNDLNNLLSFSQPVTTQLHVTPGNRSPWNIYDVQNPSNNLVAIPQNQGDLIQSVSNGHLNFPVQPESHLATNNVLSNGAMNTGFLQTNNKLVENVDITNNKYLNILENKNVRNIINAPTIENHRYNSIPLLQTQNFERYVPPNYNNDPDRQLYKVSQVNHKNHNIKEQIQFVHGSIPNHEFNNLNHPSYIKPYQYQNVGLVSPTFYSNVNTNQIPYLNSANLNRQNSLNYNSQKADATVQRNFGINLYTPTSLRDYPKHDIYGNILFDSNRLASAPNLVKLNSVADNGGIVELTYKLKRPQSVSYSPYYYMKFRLPYRDFVTKIIDLSRNPYMRSNPLKLQQELLTVSNLAETSPDLNDIQHDEVSKLILNNGGTLVNAKILGTDDLNANEYLKTIQNLNGNLNTKDILNFVENDKTSSHTTSLDSGLPIFTPEQNYGGELSHQTVNPQYNQDGKPQRLFVSMPHYASTPISLALVPTKVAPQMLSNPENPIVMVPNFK